MEPIPVRRYCCPAGHGTFSWLPPFLCRYLRFLAGIVQTAFEEYAYGLPLKSIPTTAEGPAFLTVWRWVQVLENLAVRSRLEAEAPLRIAVPQGGRPFAKRCLALARAIIENHNSNQLPAGLIQWLSLLLRPRYNRNPEPASDE